MWAPAPLLFHLLLISVTCLPRQPSTLDSSNKELAIGTARLLTLDSDIKEVQEKWRQYRNAVKDGFFFNETMIVVSDYESDKKGSGDLTESKLDNLISPVEKSDGIVESEVAAAAVNGNIETNGLEKGGFETTLTGMMDALADIQTKGDLMMGAIRGQRELLYDVRGEVREAEERLIQLERSRKEEEEKRKKAEEQRLLAEARTRMIQLERVELERELEEVEREREEVESRLQEVNEEVKAVLGEVEENGDEMFRLKEGLRPLVARLKTRKSQLNNLEVEVSDRRKVLEGVKQKIDTSEEILRNLEKKLGEADKIVGGSSSTSSLLVPVALFFSGLFNLATGGHIVSSLISSSSSSKSKMDDQPIQYAPPAQLPSYYPAGLPEDGTSGWGETMSKEGLQAGGEQRFEDMSKQDVYYSLPRSLQSQYFEGKDNS